MNILIVSATIHEIKPFLEKSNIAFDLNSIVFSGGYSNHYITILISGVGMVSTTHTLTQCLIYEDGFDFVINAGIAGSFNKNIEIGTVVNIIEDRFSEMGADNGDDFIPAEKMRFNQENKPNASLGKIENRNMKFEFINSIPQLTGVTVNKVGGNEINIKNTIALYNPDIETMEGAAFMYVCKMESQNFIQIRSISNYVEPRNINNWNIPLAINNLNDFLIKFLESI
jgi:futalosine hydrolase